MRTRTATVLALMASLMPVTPAGAQSDGAPARRAFEIAAGLVSQDAFLQGERLATVISHPPGVSRCTNAALCGPEGLIATVVATAGPAQGLVSIARGEIASTFAPADLAAAMRASAGKGKQQRSRLRAIALLERETVYLVASAKGPVRSLPRLKRRWVGVGAEQSRTRLAAEAVLKASGLGLKDIRVSGSDVGESLKLMKANRLDSFFVVGKGLPQEITAALASGDVRLVPLDAKAIASLSAGALGFEQASLPVATNPLPAPRDGVQGLPMTVSIPVVWIVDEKVPEEVVYRIARAAFHPLNQKTLQGAGADRAGVRLSKLPASFAIPVHPGAARYYAEAAKAAN